MTSPGGQLRARLRTPAIVWLVLMALLGIITTIGFTTPHGHWWMVEFACAATMVATVLIVSMEMLHHRPIVRLFSVLGFFWVGILFAMTMVDYLTR